VWQDLTSITGGQEWICSIEEGIEPAQRQLNSGIEQLNKELTKISENKA
jgi:hypothetical protein